MGWLRLWSSKPHDLGSRPVHPFFLYFPSLCFSIIYYSIPTLANSESWLTWLRLWLSIPMTCVQHLPTTYSSFCDFLIFFFYFLFCFLAFLLNDKIVIPLWFYNFFYTLFVIFFMFIFLFFYFDYDYCNFTILMINKL